MNVSLDLRKKFDREPLTTSVELQSTAELQCLPPSGDPIPEVSARSNERLDNVDHVV